MKKENIRDVFIASILGSSFTIFFTLLFSSLLDTLHPILIIYSVISALLTIVVIIVSFNLISIAVNTLKRKISNRTYWKKIDSIVPIIKKLMEEKEIYMVELIQFAKYIDKKHNIHRKLESPIYNLRDIKEATIGIINSMIRKDLLVYIESKKIIILKDKLRCIKCHEFLNIYDKVNRIEIVFFFLYQGYLNG